VAWPETSFDSWQQFIVMTESLTIGSPAYACYLYRGQSDFSWKLTPSLPRSLTGITTVTEAHEAERVALQEFKRQAAMHADTPAKVKILESSLAEWWALMQHHHAPTRLLDWSHSPFVGLYFACSANFDCDGALWLFHVKDTARAMNEKHRTFTDSRPSWEARYQDESPPSGLEVIGPQPSTNTPRMVAQQGAFTIGYNILENHDDVIDPILRPSHDSRKGNETTYYKVRVPARLKPQFLRHLRSMNVTASSLFPGIDGLGRSVAEMISLHARSPRESRA
jgi:hypothetical protein